LFSENPNGWFSDDFIIADWLSRNESALQFYSGNSSGYPQLAARRVLSRRRQGCEHLEPAAPGKSRQILWPPSIPSPERVLNRRKGLRDIKREKPQKRFESAQLSQRRMD
jgi:hypothetical protein